MATTGNINGLARQLRDALSDEKPDTIPTGWFTTEALAKKWNVSLSHAMGLVAKYKLPRQTFRVFNGHRWFPTPHYKIK